MPKLPRYSILENYDEIDGQLVFDSEERVVGKVAIYHHKDEPSIEKAMLQLANDRRAMAKVDGYYVFIYPFNTFEQRIPHDELKAILKGMANFYLSYRIGHHPGRYAKNRPQVG